MQSSVRREDGTTMSTVNSRMVYTRGELYRMKNCCPDCQLNVLNSLVLLGIRRRCVAAAEHVNVNAVISKSLILHPPNGSSHQSMSFRQLTSTNSTDGTMSTIIKPMFDNPGRC